MSGCVGKEQRRPLQVAYHISGDPLLDWQATHFFQLPPLTCCVALNSLGMMATFRVQDPHSCLTAFFPLPQDPFHLALELLQPPQNRVETEGVVRQGGAGVRARHRELTVIQNRLRLAEGELLLGGEGLKQGAREEPGEV